MNNGTANQGMRGIQEILLRYKNEHDLDLRLDVFDLRQKGEIPDLSFDIYISSGGPGSPFEGKGMKWENDFFDLLTDLEKFNKQSYFVKKHAFLICHSYQLGCRKFNVGEVIARRSTAFGIFPVFLTAGGADDLIFEGLASPFFTVDSRDWQVVSVSEPGDNLNANVLALEKERPHVDLERCIMSVRFTKEIVGTQFHPEADPVGMKMYLLRDDKKESIIANHGLEKYEDMLSSLEDVNKLQLTQSIILPNFITEALTALTEDA
ncbi:GMP synthase [Pedobacter sp. JCM 36344]|uniref:GMP synthase n=1 Tax=Pedobacter sp. JCM 36344 TaxID=3374280 RepID=UPI00397D81F9